MVGLGRWIAKAVRWSCATYLALALPSAGSAAPSRPEGAALPRAVLAVYDGEREPAPADTRIHRYAESVLNHLGFTVVYRDIRGQLPSPAEVRAYAAVLSWFSTQPTARRAYLSWAAAAAPAARKVIVLGAVGGAFWTDDARAMRAILGTIGLEHEGRAVELTLGTGMLEASSRLTRFERERDPVVPTYEVVRAARSDVDAWLRLSVPAREGGGTSVAVAVSPRGGVAAAGFEIAEDPGRDRARWLIDPFAFFGRILAAEPWPVPDVTTASGRRIAFSHVEGDGLNDVIVGPHKEKTLVAQRFLTDIVEAFPDLPVTFALTPGDLDPDLGGNATPRSLVADIWAASNVEASVASYTRPYRWSFFADYARDRELALAAAARPEAFRTAPERDGPARPGDAPRWTVGRPTEYPRNYIARPFDLAQEVEGAATVARALLPEGKALRLYQWTGDAKPFEAAIAATRRLGLPNMNGGESRFDADYPSVAHLVPLARPVGAERQIYAVGADERPLTKAWRPVTAALHGLAETLARTEWPRRLKGYHLHYHLASLGDAEALGIIRAYLEALREAAVVPVPASLYAEMAEGFFTATVTPLASGGWQIAERGALQTARFDAAGSREVDLRRSHGVLGQIRHGDALYVALDPAAEPVEIVLATKEDAAPAPVGLVDSRWQLSRLRRESGGWSYSATGFGPGAFHWEHVPAGTYRVTATGEGASDWSASVRTRADGTLAFVVPGDGRDGLAIRVVRLASEEAGHE